MSQNVDFIILDWEAKSLGKFKFEAPLRFCPLPVTCCVGDWNSRTKWDQFSIFLIVGGLEG